MSRIESRALGIAALAAWSLSFVAFALEVPLLAANSPYAFDEVSPLVAVIEDLAFVGIASLALLLLRKQPANPVGWAMMLVGVTFPLEGLVFELTAYSLRTTGQSSLALAGGWVSRWIWIGSLLSVPLILLYYPDGRLPSPGWKWAVRYVWFTAVVAFLLGATSVEPLAELGGLLNPIGLELTGARGPLSALVDSGYFALPLIGAISLIPRFRRSKGLERQQMKLIAWIAAVALLFFGVFPFLSNGPTAESLANTVFTLFVGAGITASIVRYRVFEIDRIISRTVSYTIVVAVIGVGYLAVAAVATRLLPSQDALAVAGGTLAAAAAFNPLRRRIQSAVDRKFNRPRYEAETVAREFSRMLGRAYTTEEIGETWERTVIEAMEPARSALWLSDREV